MKSSGTKIIVKISNVFFILFILQLNGTRMSRLVASRCQISKPDFVSPAAREWRSSILAWHCCQARADYFSLFHWNKFVLAPGRVCHVCSITRARVLSLLSREQKPQNTFHLSPRTAGLVLSLWYWSWSNIAIESVGVTHYHFDGVRTFLPTQ